MCGSWGPELRLSFHCVQHITGRVTHSIYIWGDAETGGCRDGETAGRGTGCEVRAVRVGGRAKDPGLGVNAASSQGWAELTYGLGLEDQLGVQDGRN